METINDLLREHIRNQKDRMKETYAKVDPPTDEEIEQSPEYKRKLRLAEKRIAKRLGLRLIGKRDAAIKGNLSFGKEMLVKAKYNNEMDDVSLGIIGEIRANHCANFFQNTTKEYFNRRFQELAVVGVKVTDEHPNSLCQEDALKLVAIIVKELGDIQYTETEEVPMFGPCSGAVKSYLFNPSKSTNDDLVVTKELLKLLKDQKYVSTRTYNTLADMLSPIRLPEKTETAKAKERVIRHKRSSITVQDGKIIEKEQEYDASESINYLIQDLGLSEEEAESLSLIPVGNLVSTYQLLGEIIGKEEAECLLLENPDIFNYSSKQDEGTNQLGSYANQISEIQGILKEHPELRKKYGINSCFEKYSSAERVERLKEDLEKRVGKIPARDYEDRVEEVEPEDTGISLQDIDLTKYTFLHQGNATIEGRLNSLVNNGEIYIGGNEHWNGGHYGARGVHALSRLKQQIRHLFNELDLNSPTLIVKRSDQGLTIDSTTQRHLSEIKTIAYSMQRKT